MSILDPAVRLVGCLSFRHKRHVPALIFGVPLVVVLGVILAGLGGRVAAVEQERDALAVPHPAGQRAPVPGGAARRRGPGQPAAQEQAVLETFRKLAA